MRYLYYLRRDQQGNPVPETARYTSSDLNRAGQEALWDVIPEDDEPWWDQELEQE